MTDAPEPRLKPLERILGNIERAGNALPQPATLFALLALLILLASAGAAILGVQAVNPSNGQTITAVNLLSEAGFNRILSETVRNFITFPPLGVVLVCLIGIAVAEHTGLLGAFVRALVLSAPRRLLTPLVVFAGVASSVAGDVGYVLLIPLAASLFHAVGRHPLAGLAAAFSGVSGGFSANLVVGVIDVLLAGLTESAARLVEPDYTVSGLANYYFLAVSTLVITAAGTWVTHRIVEPRLGAYQGSVAPAPLSALQPDERRGLTWTAVFLAVFASVVLAGLWPHGGFLRDPAHPDSVLKSLFLANLVPFIFVAGLGSGLAYGLGARTVRSDADVVQGMERSLGTMGGYIVLAFFAAQFIAYFNWSNLGLILAIKGAEGIKALGLEDRPIPLIVALVLFSASINLLIASASAKWALLAPVFVPMFMLLGYSPELVQAAYRVGDSCTNIITPLMAYFPLILTFARHYDRETGLGTIVATMLPYSCTFLVVWTALLIAWIVAGLPVGVDAPLTLER